MVSFDTINRNGASTEVSKTHMPSAHRKTSETKFYRTSLVHLHQNPVVKHKLTVCKSKHCHCAQSSQKSSKKECEWEEENKKKKLEEETKQWEADGWRKGREMTTKLSFYGQRGWKFLQVLFTAESYVISAHTQTDDEVFPCSPVVRWTQCTVCVDRWISELQTPHNKTLATGKAMLFVSFSLRVFSFLLSATEWTTTIKAET